MDTDLKEQLVHAMLRFKKIGMNLPPDIDIRMGELYVLKGIERHTFCSDRPAYVSDIQSKLFITMPAVSQILSGLEKKGYVTRQADRSDRRKVAVALTPSGKDILSRTKEYTNQMIGETICRFGEENTRQLIRLLTLLADVSEETKRESPQTDKK